MYSPNTSPISAYIQVDLSSSCSFSLNDESCSSDATVPVQGLGQQAEQGLGMMAADDDGLRIAAEVDGDGSVFLVADLDCTPDEAATTIEGEGEVVDFLNTSNGPLSMAVSDVPSSSSSSSVGHDSLWVDPSHMDSCPDDDHGLVVENTDSTCVDVPAVAVAMTDKEEGGQRDEVSSPSLVDPQLAPVPDAASTACSVTSAIPTITPTSSTSEMRAEALAPSAELLVAACAPSSLLAAATLMVETSGDASGDATPATPTALAAGLFASPCLDASAVGFAVALLSLLSACGNSNDGVDLVHGLAPWLWSLLPLLRSSPSDDEEDQMDCSDPQSSQATAASSDVLDATAVASSSSGLGASKRKGKQQKTATATAAPVCKEKAGKKNQKANSKEPEAGSTKPRQPGRRRVQFCFVDGSSVQPPVSGSGALF